MANPSSSDPFGGEDVSSAVKTRALDGQLSRAPVPYHSVPMPCLRSRQTLEETSSVSAHSHLLRISLWSHLSLTRVGWKQSSVVDPSILCRLRELRYFSQIEILLICNGSTLQHESVLSEALKECR